MESSNGDETSKGNIFAFGGKASASLYQELSKKGNIFARAGIAYRTSKADILDVKGLIKSIDIGVKF